jgi:XTP/dITP diphosphohydrolase
VRLTLLLTSPRVAPGLLTWGAWTAVASASLRLASSAEDPLARAVAGAGHPVQLLDGSASLMLEAARHDDVVWLASDEEAGRLPTELATALVDRPSEVVGDVEVEVLHGSYDVPGARLLDLVTVMDRLRSECPWDQQQTHRSLATYLLEETYETLEAIESGDYGHLREELGDLLLQVYFHARIAAEAGDEGFTIDDVAAGIVDKLVHRHPHVFAGRDVLDADEVNRNWETLKAAEKGRGSVLEGVPLGLPALALADKVVGRAARVGVTPAGSATLGERLLTLVVEARAAGADPEQELREAVRRLTEAVRAAESR